MGITLHSQATNNWYEVQDLHVREILPQMITLSESYIQARYFYHFYRKFFGIIVTIYSLDLPEAEARHVILVPIIVFLRCLHEITKFTNKLYYYANGRNIPSEAG